VNTVDEDVGVRKGFLQESVVIGLVTRRVISETE
jgi:hypothetical protein